jgi:hypothetical protein
MLVAAIASWAGAYKPEPEGTKPVSMDDLQGLFPGGQIR